MKRLNLRAAAWSMILVALFSGCRRELEPSEWMSAVTSDAAMVRTWQDDNFRVTCSHLPAELIALQELQAFPDASREQFQERAEAFSHAWYVRFSIGMRNGMNIETSGMRSDAEYQQRLHRLQQEMASQFSLRLGNGRELAPLSCEYQRTFGMTNEATFLLAFPSPDDASETCTVRYDDREFGIAKPVRLDFDLREIRSAVPDVRI